MEQRNVFASNNVESGKVNFKSFYCSFIFIDSKVICPSSPILWGQTSHLLMSLKIAYSILNYFILFYILWLHLWHMEGPRLGVELELQLLA